VNNNALPIKAAVARYAVFQLKHIMVAIEPDFQSHDVWNLTKGRWQYEWEIKQSMSDLRREAEKWKHKSGQLVKPSFGHQYGHWPNRFFIVVPLKIAVKAQGWLFANLPYAGLLSVDKNNALTQLLPAQLLHRERANLHRCAKVARWMASSVADLLEDRVIKDRVRIPRTIPVTDDGIDAPDGAECTVTFKRCGDQWERLDHTDRYDVRRRSKPKATIPSGEISAKRNPQST